MARGLHGVQLAVSDDHAGLKRAIRETLPEAHWQRCYVHFLRNALDYLPRKADDDCLQELRWLYDRRGSELFDDITRLPAYYPTRTETALLEAKMPEIAEAGYTSLWLPPPSKGGSGTMLKMPTNTLMAMSR